MPAVRSSMRNTREILRLRWGLGRSIRETARSCGVGTTTVHDAVARAKAARLSWPRPPDLDDGAPETRLYPVCPYRDPGHPSREHHRETEMLLGVTPQTLPERVPIVIEWEAGGA